MTEQLKPCPFCAGPAEIIDAVNEAWAHCLDERCNGSGPMRPAPSRAIVAWNRRATPAPVVEISEEMVERACIALAEGDWALYGPEYQDVSRRVMRAALVAAIGGQS